MVLLSQASASSWTSGDAVDAETEQKDAADSCCSPTIGISSKKMTLPGTLTEHCGHQPLHLGVHSSGPV